MPEIKTPGVYVTEVAWLPPSVAQMETSVPAFVGYTEKADDNGTSLKHKPRRVTSLLEYEQHFGGAPRIVFAAKKVGDVYQLAPAWSVDMLFVLYASMRLFFANGGGACYVVSVGRYAEGPIAANALIAGLDLLKQEQEPAIVVVPDAMRLAAPEDCLRVQQSMVNHCGLVMKDRVAVLDVYQARTTDNPVQDFRNGIGSEGLSYAAAYYPWLETSVFEEKDVTKDMVDPPDAYSSVCGEVLRQLNVLPPSGAIAGVYAMVDSTRGVWKAPANVALKNVVKPTVAISNAEQAGLNVDTTAGKSINAIRNFAGRGVLVWGARTLAGNDNEWRYINVRRMMIMIEGSVKSALQPFIFEPNAAPTWAKVKGMIENYLNGLWRNGALMGTKPEQAFSVNIGLGDTMTAQDILEGNMIVMLMVAVSRPAEFLVIKLQQKMQTS